MSARWIRQDNDNWRKVQSRAVAFLDVCYVRGMSLLVVIVLQSAGRVTGSADRRSFEVKTPQSGIG